MSNVCAKPTCAELARLWFDFAPAERRVTQRAERGESSVGLCAAHGERFGVPAGWDFERLPGPEATTENQPARGRERPWFVPSSNDLAFTTNESTAARADDVLHNAAHEPSAGSLLHRAFHGPDRQTDLHRAAHDELERRRVARADEDACGPVELPFPPYEAEHQIAVS